MVRFEPTISYSDEASKIFKEYRELKDKQEKAEKTRLSKAIAYATLKLDTLTEDMDERVKEFYKDNKDKLSYSGEIITREYCSQYLSGRRGEFFLTEDLINFLQLNPEHKVKVMAIYESFDKAMAKEMVYQNIIYRKSEENCTMANIQECFGEREWFLVDFFDYEGNIQLVKNVEEMNKK